MPSRIAGLLTGLVLTFGLLAAPTGAVAATTDTWWHPSTDQPLAFQWVLSGALDVHDPVSLGWQTQDGQPLPHPDVYDIDGVDNPASTVQWLHDHGTKVICYFDAGAYETYRPDAWKFQQIQPRIWGNHDVGWPGSYWLDIRRINDLAPIMKARIENCRRKGFDAVEPDEITGWSNHSGFPLTYDDQLVYNRAIARWVHAAGLSVGLKGDLEQAHDLVGDFDWTLNEQCFQYHECVSVLNRGPGADGRLHPGLPVFSDAGKAVWVAEYHQPSPDRWADDCAVSVEQHWNTTLFHLNLGTHQDRRPCPTTGW